MNTINTHVTAQDVLEVLDTKAIRHSIGEDDIRYAVPFSYPDIIDAIAVKRGFVQTYRAFETRTSGMRKYVNFGDVKRALEALVASEGVLWGKGDHWALRSHPGASRASTYYFSRKGAALAIAAEQARLANVREKAAQAEAARIILARYADEVKNEWETILEGQSGDQVSWGNHSTN